MNSNIKCILAFTAGAVIGAAVSAKYLNKKYELIAQDKIDSIKSEYCTPRCETVKPTEMEVYENIASRYSKPTEPETSSVNIEDDDKPYVITPEELGDVDEYDTDTLYYYADGVLVTLQDEIVEDVEGTVGKDFANHFGEYEDDSVCVRNPRHKCDYEILRDFRRFVDVKTARPREAEE